MRKVIKWLIVLGVLAGGAVGTYAWLTGRDTVMPALIAINAWKLFPFVAVMVLAGLQTVPNELYESARIDGANFWQEVRHIMLPQLRAVLTAITLLLVAAERLFHRS